MLTMTDVERIQAEALQLPPDLRERLAERLISSLEEDPAERASRADVERRMAKIRAGKGVFLELDEVLAELDRDDD